MPTHVMATWQFVHEPTMATLVLSLVRSLGRVNDSWVQEHTLQLSACLQHNKQVDEPAEHF